MTDGKSKPKFGHSNDAFFQLFLLKLKQKGKDNEEKVSFVSK